MSFLKTSMTAVAALSLAATPALAQAANPASALSVSRESASVEGNELGGGFIIPLLALAAVILGILVVVDGDDDLPDSP